MSRPKRDRGRERQVTIWLSTQEKSVVLAAAESVGLTLSAYIRTRMIEAAREDGFKIIPETDLETGFQRSE